MPEECPSFPFLLNIAWIVCGGLEMALGWLVAAVIMAITIWDSLGEGCVQHCLLHAAAVLPESGFARRLFRPGGHRHRTSWGSGKKHHMAGARGVVAGARHVIVAAFLAVTIIGIPFAWAHLKLAGIALWPIGKTIVGADEAAFHYARRN